MPRTDDPRLSPSRQPYLVITLRPTPCQDHQYQPAMVLQWGSEGKGATAPKRDMKHRRTNSKHQHIGAKTRIELEEYLYSAFIQR